MVSLLTTQEEGTRWVLRWEGQISYSDLFPLVGNHFC